MINLDKLDPDWKFATEHGKASFAGMPLATTQSTQQSFSSQHELNKNVLCKCCYEHVHKIPVPLCENSKQLQFLGFGYPLFYEFLKNCIILLLLAAFSYNVISMKLAFDENYNVCQTTQSSDHRLLASESNTTSSVSCYTFMVQLSRIQQKISSFQQAIRIISYVLHMAALLYIRNRISKLQKYYDERTTSLSDYSIQFSGITKMKGIQKNLKQFLNKQFKRPHTVMQITLLPEYPSIQSLQSDKNKVIKQLKAHYDRQETEDQCEEMAKKMAQLKRLQKVIHDQALISKNLAMHDELQCEKIICVFNTQQQKDDILEEFNQISIENKSKYFGEGAQKIIAVEAPEPQQIIWQNANLPKNKRVLYILLGWGLSILVLVAIFIVFFFVLSEKSYALQAALQQKDLHADDIKALQKLRASIILVYILIFLVVIFDKLAMAWLFHKFTDLQKHESTSSYQFSYELKLALGLFFTTALMTLAVQAIRFHNYYSHPYGVIDEQSIMFIMNSLFVPVFWLIHPTRIYKLIKRKMNFGKRSLTQREANKLMEQQSYDMGKRFAEIIEMMWFTFLYSTLIPIGVVITVFGLFCYYWVDKYNLLRRSSVSGQISGRLIMLSLKLLDLTLLLRPLGAIIFDSQIRQSYMPSNVVMIVVALVYVFMPKDKLISIFNDEKFRPEQKTYLEAKQSFHKTYHTEHPVYRIIYSQKLTQKMLKRGHSFNENFKTQQTLPQVNKSQLNQSNMIFIGQKKSKEPTNMQEIEQRQTPV